MPHNRSVLQTAHSELLPRIGRRWICLQAPHEVALQALNRLQNPSVVREDVCLLLWVAQEIEEIRRFELARRVIHLGLPYQVELPVFPLDGSELVLDVEQETFPLRFHLHRILEECDLAYSIDWPICRDLRTRDFAYRCKQICDVHDIIRCCTSWHMRRPADDAWHAQTAFHGCVVCAHPWPCCTSIRGTEFWPIVRCEYKNRVVSKAEMVHMVQKLANAMIHLSH